MAEITYGAKLKRTEGVEVSGTTFGGSHKKQKAQEKYVEQKKEAAEKQEYELARMSAFEEQESERLSEMADTDKEAWETAKTLVEVKEQARYDGNLGGINLEDGKITPDNNLQGYNIEYYDDGVTPKKILGSQKTYTSDRYGSKITKDNYYANEWNFYEDGSIKSFSKKYDYKDDKGKVGSTSYYSRKIGDQEKWEFKDDDGILSQYNKYDVKKTDDDSWDNKSIFTEQYDDGVKIKQVEREWSNSDRNWKNIKEQDFITGVQKVDTSFTSYAPKVDTDITAGKTVESSRVIYEPHPTQPGATIAKTIIDTFKDGTISIKDSTTGNISYFKTESGQPIHAGQLSIPNLNILSYKEQIEQKMKAGMPVKYSAPVFQRREYTSSVPLTGFQWQPTNFEQQYVSKKTYSAPTIPKINNNNLFYYTKSSRGLKVENNETQGQKGVKPTYFQMAKRWKGPIGGQNIGNKIRDYAGEFKKKTLTQKKKLFQGKI